MVLPSCKSTAKLASSNMSLGSVGLSAKHMYFTHIQSSLRSVQGALSYGMQMQTSTLCMISSQYQNLFAKQKQCIVLCCMCRRANYTSPDAKNPPHRDQAKRLANGRASYCEKMAPHYLDSTTAESWGSKSVLHHCVVISHCPMKIEQDFTSGYRCTK